MLMVGSLVLEKTLGNTQLVQYGNPALSLAQPAGFHPHILLVVDIE
jgi:hypothetical protein